ncbi:protein SHORT HYPOCOTYL IN WHITE LIGHT 1 isoform X2 [Carica papaya]|uniref:protein SHORT HYPOCOTYL IN WHITE LIGHT 1 isoform X2 n=1 Tax=Carica papaya TaxID=3649 RepID=UPI000B8CAC5B|nr:protein SHORT HYPOCOTYL IN WHITE LIGHT 1 isoform X2 [Carica papaya]
MAAAAQTLSSPPCMNLTPTRTKPLLHSSLSPTAILPLPLHLHLHYKKPTAIVCNAQLDNSVGEEHDSIDDPFFDMYAMAESESDEDDETESSVDLLIRFLQSMFKKVSKRAKKASRSLLPPAISPQLVICTLGGTVFVALLLLRVIWAAIAYFQSSGDGVSHGGSFSGDTQPVT